jgi:hypothetical protein
MEGRKMVQRDGMGGLFASSRWPLSSVWWWRFSKWTGGSRAFVTLENVRPTRFEYEMRQRESECVCVCVCMCVRGGSSPNQHKTVYVCDMFSFECPTHGSVARTSNVILYIILIAMILRGVKLALLAPSWLPPLGSNILQQLHFDLDAGCTTAPHTMQNFIGRIYHVYLCSESYDMINSTYLHVPKLSLVCINHPPPP